MKRTEAVGVMVTASVASNAVKVASPLVVDRTTKVTTPAGSARPDGADTASVAPRLDVRETAFPFTGAPDALRRATRIVALVAPSATTVSGSAVTIESLPEGRAAGVSETPELPPHAVEKHSAAAHTHDADTRNVIGIPLVILTLREVEFEGKRIPAPAPVGQAARLPRSWD
jgi:hypothetical protein